MVRVYSWDGGDGFICMVERKTDEQRRFALIQMVKKISLNEIERIVYIWARYEGRRDVTKEGKHYDKGDVQDLIRRLQRFKDDPTSFEEGFEKEEKPAPKQD